MCFVDFEHFFGYKYTRKIGKVKKRDVVFCLDIAVLLS